MIVKLTGNIVRHISSVKILEILIHFMDWLVSENWEVLVKTVLLVNIPINI